MPHVASDFSAIHAPSHNHGARGRAAHADDRAPTSPFSELVDAADAPAPPMKDRGEPAPNGPANKARPAGETRPEPSAPAAQGSETDDQAPVADPAAVLRIALGLDDGVPADGAEADATGLAADTTEADKADAEQTEVAAEGDETAKIDAIDAALMVAPPADPNTPLPAAEPRVAAIPTTTDAPASAPAVPADAGKVDAATADGADGAIVGEAIKSATADRPAPGAAKTRGGKDTAATGPKRHGESQQAGAAGAAAANDAEPDTTETTAAAKAAGLDGDRPPVPQDKADHAPEHAHLRPGAVKSEKPDSLSNPTPGASVSDAANGARPPSETGQAAVAANDRLAAAAPTSPTASSQSAADEAPVPLAGLAVEIASRALAGRNRFEIRLDPPELGRIDVRLDVDTGGNVTSRLVVDRVETFDALRRDASDLERALQQAGLKMSENSLQFSLRDHGFAGRDSNGDPPNTARLVVPDSTLAPVDTLQGGYGRMLRAGGGVDIRV